MGQVKKNTRHCKEALRRSNPVAICDRAKCNNRSSIATGLLHARSGIRNDSSFLGIAVCIMLLIITSSFKEPVEKAKLYIHIEHYAGLKPLQLDSVYYKNELGQSFTVSKFRYYISNIRLKKTIGPTISLPGYFLVDEADPESKSITLNNVPEGLYSSVSFIIGVDSLHNCTGAQTGALDPVNGMFWTWSTGYIFLKMEGHADASASPGHIFEYHIGGYAAPNNCIRRVELNFGKKGLSIYDNKDNALPLKADVLQLLKTPTVIDFSKLSSVTDHHNATTIADNYADMFTINADE
jgi:hypothetical protein